MHPSPPEPQSCCGRWWAYGRGRPCNLEMLKHEAASWKLSTVAHRDAHTTGHQTSATAVCDLNTAALTGRSAHSPERPVRLLRVDGYGDCGGDVGHGGWSGRCAARPGGGQGRLTGRQGSQRGRRAGRGRGRDHQGVLLPRHGRPHERLQVPLDERARGRHGGRRWRQLLPQPFGVTRFVFEVVNSLRTPSRDTEV